MKAMIFAAGLGTRLKPFTLEHPKALVPLAGVPMLERVIQKLKAAGIDEIVVNVHHFASQIVDFLRANDNFGIKVHISDESSLLLDTGGGILAARRWLDAGDEPFVVHNADIYTDFDITKMIDSHCKSGAEATLLVAPRNTSRYLLFSPDMRLQGWTNINTGQVKPAELNTDGLRALAFGGVHVLQPSIFKHLAQYIDTNTPFSIIDFYIYMCRNIIEKGYMPEEAYNWHDIGKPDSLAKAEHFHHSLKAI